MEGSRSGALVLPRGWPGWGGALRMLWLRVWNCVRARKADRVEERPEEDQNQPWKVEVSSDT